MRRRIFVIGLFLLVICAGIVSRVLSWYNQPFRLKPYLDYVHSKQLYVAPPEGVVKYAKEKSLLVNVPAAFEKGDIRRRVFIIDSDRLISDWKTPFSFRKFTQGRLYSGGVTFACQQVLLMNGSLLTQSPRSFLARMSGLPEEFISADKDNLSMVDAFMFVFFHEFAHLTDFHTLSEEAQEDSLNQAWKLGNDALASGHNDVAVMRFQEALRICPADYEALDHEARAEVRRGNVSRGIDLYRKSLSMNSNNRVARDNIVMALVLSGRLNEALQQIGDNERADPKDPESVFWLGVIGARTGDLLGSYSAFYKARERYLAEKDEKVVHANLARYALVTADKNIGTKPSVIFQQHRQDCRAVKTSEFAQMCESDEQEFRSVALRVLKGMQMYP